MTDRMKELMQIYGAHRYIDEGCQKRMEYFATAIIKEIEKYIEESEGDIDYVRFLIDKNLK